MTSLNFFQRYSNPKLFLVHFCYLFFSRSSACSIGMRVSEVSKSRAVRNKVEKGEYAETEQAVSSKGPPLQEVARIIP